MGEGDAGEDREQTRKKSGRTGESEAAARDGVHGVD